MKRILNKNKESSAGTKNFIDKIIEIGDVSDRNISKMASKFNDVDKSVIKTAEALKAGTINLSEFKAQAQSASASTSTFKESLKSIGSNLLSIGTNMAIMLGVSLAIKGAVWVYDQIIHRQEMLNEKATESANSYRSLINEIDSLNSELQTTSQRIDELNGKKNLSLVEQDELNKLKEKNTELERELIIKQRLADIANKKANDDSKAALMLSGKYGYDNGSEFVSVQGNQIDVAKLQVEHYQFMQNSIKRTKEQMDALIKADPANYMSNLEYLDLANSYDDLIYTSDDLEKTVTENISTFMALDDSLSSSNEESKKLLDSLSLLYNEFDKVFYGIGQSSDRQIGEIFSRPTLEAAKETLVDLGKQGLLSVDALVTRFSGLITTLVEAGISAEDLYKYIMALADPSSVNLDAVRKSLYDQYITPYAGSDEMELNRIASEYFKWLNSKSTEELEIIYSIKSSENTDSWSFEDYDLELEKRQNSVPEISFSDFFSTKRKT